MTSFFTPFATAAVTLSGDVHTNQNVLLFTEQVEKRVISSLSLATILSKSLLSVQLIVQLLRADKNADNVSHAPIPLNSF